MHGVPRASVSNSALTCLNQCSIEAKNSEIESETSDSRSMKSIPVASICAVVSGSRTVTVCPKI